MHAYNQSLTYNQGRIHVYTSLIHYRNKQKKHKTYNLLGSQLNLYLAGR